MRASGLRIDFGSHTAGTDLYGRLMTELRCTVFRGLARELEEQLNKFLESNACQIHFVLQSESRDHTTLTLIYELDSRDSTLAM